MTEAKIAASEAHLQSAKIAIELSKKGVESLELKLKKYKLYAPIDGYVITKKAQKSQSVQALQTIVQIVNPKDVWVVAHIDERVSGRIKVAQKAVITLRSKEGEKFTGVVKRVAPMSDAITQEREVDVAFTNLPKPFYMNEQAEVKIFTKSLKNVLTIPAELIVYKESSAGVWVEKEGKAHLKKIEVVAISEGRASIKKLTTGDKLLRVSPKNKPLDEGMRVH